MIVSHSSIYETLDYIAFFGSVFSNLATTNVSGARKAHKHTSTSRYTHHRSGVSKGRDKTISLSDANVWVTGQ